MSARLPRVSAFSIVKNAERYDYPVQVALRSVLPLCDELLVNVGRSDDRTLELVRELDDPRIRVFERAWSEEDIALSRETNWILERCTHEWGLYIQADEVLHEDDYPAIRRALARAAADPRVEGLAFDYLHFYGSPRWVLRGRRAFRREIRLVRRSSGIRSVAGAQGFRIDGRRPWVLASGGRVFHYGYAKSHRALTEKRRLSARYEGRPDARVGPWEFRRPSDLRPFSGTHPGVAREWVKGRAWPFDPDSARPEPLTPRELKRRISDGIERFTGRRPFEHRNYRMLR